MLKFVNFDIVFQEIPDEVTLAVNISNCPCRCEGCHSRYLWEDVGEPLTEEVVDGLVKRYGGGITCVCFMGGDADPEAVVSLSCHIHERYPDLKVGWYSGRSHVPEPFFEQAFDYLKLGPYVETLGGLSSPSTNQRLYRREPDGSLTDITERFWK